VRTVPTTKKKLAQPAADYLDRLEIARMLKIRPETISDLVRKNIFQPPIIFNKRLQRWSRRTVEDFLRGLEGSAP
jgi:hypothetical protein